MWKRMTVVSLTGLAVLGAGPLAGAANKPHTPHRNAVTVVAVLGSAVDVPPGQFVKAYAFCPKGYYVTGGGSYSGAITEIASSPLPNLRGWFVDGTNDDPQKRTFQHRADAVCMKGHQPVTVGTAADGRSLQQAERDYVSRHGGR